MEHDNTSNQSIQFNWFWHFVKQAKDSFEFENSSFHAAIGERRTGKSIFCLGMACAVDPDFTVDQICFGVDELKLQLSRRTRASIIFEEAGVGAFNRDFMTESNRVLAKALQVFGFRKLNIIANLQHINFLDSALRLQLNTFFRMSATHNFIDGKPVTQAYAEPFVLKTDWINDPIISRYKITHEGVYTPLGLIPIPQVDQFFKLCGVSDTLYRDYEKKKYDYFKFVVSESVPEANQLSKRELALLQRKGAACETLMRALVSEKVCSLRDISRLSDVPKSTLSDWLSEK